MRNALIILFTTLCSFQLYAQSSNIILLDNWDNDTLPLDFLNATFNECWGFVYDGQEYAVIGSTVGTHLFKITAADELEEIQFIHGYGTNIIHRDYHDYNDILYGVSDEESGLDIMYMNTLPDSLTRVRMGSPFANTHNIFIDSATATMYCCDAMSWDIFSIEGPDSLVPKWPYSLPSFDYVHDIYARRDSLFMNSSYYGLTYIDMGAPSPLTHSLEFYPEKGYNHSGWLSDDGKVYAFADETIGSSVKVCDASDWTDLQVTSLIKPPTFDSTMAHNLMIKGNLLYISYYYDGLQVYDISDIYNPIRVAYYDTYQGADSTVFEGAWGVYCFLPSGRILVSDRHNGLFLLKLDPSVVTDLESIELETHIDHFRFKFETEGQRTIQIFSLNGQPMFDKETRSNSIQISNDSWAEGIYIYRVLHDSGQTTGKFIHSP